ncbi:MAG: lamin tail domain-containing protein, partial [Nocardioides sp.]
MFSSSLPTHRGGRRRQAGVAAALVGLVSTTLALGLSAPAQAVSTGVVIAEVYGGGTNSGAANTYGNDFIELENRGTVPVNLNGWSVQYHSATGTGAYAVHELTGTIPAGSRYLLQEGAFTTGTQFVADEQGTLNMAAGSGVVALVSNTTPFPTFGTSTGVNLAGSTANGLVDLVGYGNTANTYETARTGTALSNTLSTNRKSVVDSDNNNTDFQNLAPSPTACNCPVPTAPKLVISEVFSHGTSGGPHGADFVEVHNFGSAAADLSQVTLDVAGGSPVPLTGSLAAGGYQAVDVDLTDDNGSTSLIWEHDSSVVDLVGWGTGAHEGDEAAPAGSATESAQRDEEDTDTDHNGADFRSATPSRGSAYVPPPAPLSTIAEIQGTGAASPKVGDRVRTQGVVTASYPSGTGNLGGFYVQTGGQDGVDYDTPGTSDALYVFSGSKTPPAIGT